MLHEYRTSKSLLLTCLVFGSHCFPMIIVFCFFFQLNLFFYFTGGVLLPIFWCNDMDLLRQQSFTFRRTILSTSLHFCRAFCRSFVGDNQRLHRRTSLPFGRQSTLHFLHLETDYYRHRMVKICSGN